MLFFSTHQVGRWFLMALITVCATSVFGDFPLAVSLGEVIPRGDVSGVHLSLVGRGPGTVNGLSLGVVNAFAEGEMRGIQVAGLLAGDDSAWGLHVGGAFAFAEEMTGLQLGGIASLTGLDHALTGVQIAGVLSQCGGSSSVVSRGLQIACYNGAQSMCGVQIGLVNFALPAPGAWVVQIGLVNGIGQDEHDTFLSGIRYMPLVNVGF